MPTMTKKKGGVPHIGEVHWDLDRVFLGFNRTAFLHDILLRDFQGNIKSCAEAVGLPANYLRDLVYSSCRNAGVKTLTTVFRYCIRTGRKPENFIFIVRDSPPWDEDDENMKGEDVRTWTPQK